MTAVSAVDDLEEVAAFINVQFHQSKVIYNKQIESGQLLGIVQIFTCNLSLLQLIDQCAGLYVSYGMEQPQCTDAQGIGYVGFTGTGASGDQKVLSFVNPVTGSKSFDGTGIKEAVCIINGFINVCCRLFQGCFL